MADYKYIGITTYIKDTEENRMKLGFLAEEALCGLRDKLLDGLFDEHKITNEVFMVEISEEYQYLVDNSGFTSGINGSYPNGTPTQNQEMHMQVGNVKGIDLIRLYVPIISKREAESYAYRALQPVLERLYGEDLLTMKIKEGMEYDNYAVLEERVVLSAKRD
ncbi:hypothetical protein [Shouchella clausii]|uniref:Uncharacterized protein n=1 Tax=Shouchella clausii TaxID=79880 RepID=A0A268NWC7_SHOCL|nr:hypothetical protein [Shouchella clausii]PAE87812.1 hypothetical protein CHH72_16405 [Shouchella clausii]